MTAQVHLTAPGGGGDTDAPGLRNTPYANVMAAWTPARALEPLDQLPIDPGNRRLRISVDLRHLELNLS
jgi:hypothetical protein